jgi:large subunit ribosomal protein L24
MSKFHVRNGDEVEVISGGAKGKKGKVVKILTAKNQVIVEGARTITKATRAKQGAEGGLIKQDGPVHISNVKVLVPVQRESKKAAK